jgi:hypothetical protein
VGDDAVLDQQAARVVERDAVDAVVVGDALMNCRLPFDVPVSFTQPLPKPLDERLRPAMPMKRTYCALLLETPLPPEPWMIGRRGHRAGVVRVTVGGDVGVRRVCHRAERGEGQRR